MESIQKIFIYILFSIFTTARIIEGKGIQYVIESLGNLLKGNIRGFHYTIIGDGPYKDTILELAKKYKVEKYITVTGFIERHEVLSLLGNCDVFVLPSKSEGMPNVVL